MLDSEARASVALDGQTFAAGLPTAWIFDLDGTLFQTNRDAPSGGRDWYDYARLLEDWPIPATIDCALSLQRSGQKLLFVTARPHEARDLTIQQLRRHYLVNERDEIDLFMRPTSEHLDHDLKREIYVNLIKPRWQIQGVFEDNPDVVDMWVSCGLTVFQVKGPHNRDKPPAGTESMTDRIAAP